MDPEQVLKLLEQLESNGGGMVLKMGDASRAVILSMDNYIALTGGEGVGVVNNINSEPIKEGSEKRKILVTGGAGYIGGHVTRVLLEAGHEVFVLDNFVSGKREYLPANVTCVEGDVRDANLLRDIFSNFGIDSVVHLAALLEVNESVKEPFLYFDVNVLGTATLLSAMNEYGVKNLVFSSTASVYGGSLLPLSEDNELKPSSPYGQTKLLAERVIEYYTKNSDLKATVLRFFNVAGRNAEWPIYDTHHRSHLIPIVLEVAQGKEQVLTLNGDDYETFDGSCVRDYVHVMDIASAHSLALEKAGAERFRVYNVGTGHGKSVKEVVTVATEVTGHMIPMVVGPRRPGDDQQSVAKVDKIKTELGFEAKHSSLEAIIRTSMS